MAIYRCSSAQLGSIHMAKGLQSPIYHSTQKWRCSGAPLVSIHMTIHLQLLIFKFINKYIDAHMHVWFPFLRSYTSPIYNFTHKRRCSGAPLVPIDMAIHLQSSIYNFTQKRIFKMCSFWVKNVIDLKHFQL